WRRVAHNLPPDTSPGGPRRSNVGTRNPVGGRALVRPRRLEPRTSVVRIAQVAPLYECVPPKLYGGTERVVAYLTDELVRQGHEVTLFASGGSKTLAEHVEIGRSATRLDPDCRDPLARHVVLMERVFSRVAEFDIVHFHIAYLHI